MNKKGFTLIELLAVIVILAVIALIVTPIVTGIIKQAKESADLRSAEGYVKAAEEYYASIQLEPNGEQKLNKNVIDDLSLSNNVATGSVVLYSNSNVGMAIKIGDKCYKKAPSGNINSITVTDDEICIYNNTVVPPESCFTYSVNGSEAIITGYTCGDSFSSYEFVEPRKYDSGVCHFDPLNVHKFNFDSSSSYREIEIPSTLGGYSVTEIAPFAFSTYSELNFMNPDISGSQCSYVIDDSSFHHKNGITSLVIPSSVKKIGMLSFAFNELENVVIPSGTEDIGGYAFYGNNIVSLSIPNTNINIETSAFNNNKLNDNNAFIYAKNDNGTNNLTNIVSYGGKNKDNIIIPNGVTTIGSCAFCSCGIKSVTLPSSLTTIMRYAFQMNELTKIIIPNNVTILEEEAFSANYLSSIEFGNYITTIGSKSFDSNKLSNVIIPKSIKSIGQQAFQNNLLTNVDIIGKTSSNEFENYNTNIWGWKTGYSESNINWNK